MDVIEAIYNRRASKLFDPEHQLTADEERKLFESMIQALTSFNIQHWRFVEFRDLELRKRIRTEFGNNQAQMTDASLLVMFTADEKKIWRNLIATLGDLHVHSENERSSIRGIPT